MYEGLKPCTHRTVDNSGRILCGLIKGADAEVSVNLCRGCPVPQINCEHLRAGIQKSNPSPITVRFATGRTEVWDDELPRVEFKQAACFVKTIPIHSPRDCSGCPLRVPQVIPQSAVQVARKSATVAGAERGVAASPVVQAKAIEEKSSEGITSLATTEIAGRAQALRAKKQSEANAPQTRLSANEHARKSRDSQPKIIQLQRWLSDQISRKAQVEEQVPTGQADSVQDIVFGHNDPAYEEEPGYERCVGWTD